MSRKKIYLILVSILAIIFCSCKNNDNEYEPDYQIFQSVEYVPEEQHTISDNSYDSTDNITHGTGTRDENNSLPLSTEEEQWPYPLEFEGVTPSGDNKAGNLSVNVKYYWTNLSNLICPDTENNSMFYVNYGRDNYLYKHKDGVSSLLLEKEVYFCSCGIISYIF